MRSRSAVLLLAATLIVGTAPAAFAAAPNIEAANGSLGRTSTVTGELYVAMANGAEGEHTIMAVRGADGDFIPVDVPSVQNALGDVAAGSTVSLKVADAPTGGAGQPDADDSVVVSGEVLVAEAVTPVADQTDGLAGAGIAAGAAIAASSAVAPFDHPTYITRVNDTAATGAYTDATARASLKLGADYWKRESTGSFASWTVKAASKTLTRNNVCAEIAPVDPWGVWEAAMAQYPSVTFSLNAGAPTLVVYVPLSCMQSGVGFTGLTTIGSMRSGGLALIVLGDEATMGHELGHALGLGHANLDLRTGAAPIEYGGLHSVMGADILKSNDPAQGGYPAPALDVASEYFFGLLPANQSRILQNGGAATVTLAPVSSASGVRVAMFPALAADGRAVLYAVEYRDAKGTDAPTAYALADGTPSYPLGGTSVAFGAGVRVYRIDAGGATSGLGTTTMTVADPTGPASVRASLAAGMTYQDPGGAFTVAVTGVGATATVSIASRTYVRINGKTSITSTYGKKRAFAGTFSNTRATGTVTVREGSRTLGHATIARGRVSVALPKNLKAGKHTLRVTYSGVAGLSGFYPVSGNIKLTVKKAKAKAKIKASKAQLKRKKTAKVKVYLRKVLTTKPTGKVYLKVGKKVISKKVAVKKSHGKYVAVVTTKKLTKKGKVKAVFVPKSKNLAKTTYSTKYKVR